MDKQAPFTLAETAIALHEFYLSLVEAGFDDEQAMYLVGEILAIQGAEYDD